MPLDPDVAELLETLAAVDAPALSDGGVSEARTNYDAAPKPDADPLARVEDRVLPGPGGDIDVRVYAPSVAEGLPVVVFFHGGGWVLSSLDGHDALARRIAARSGAMVVSVDYRLAPEHPFPAPHDDCWTVTAWLARNADRWGGDRSRLAVCGDSAGGNLAAGVALRARDEGLDLALQSLIYPCIDDRQDEYPSMKENGEGYFLTATDMGWFWDHFVPASVPQRSLRRYRAAPMISTTSLRHSSRPPSSIRSATRARRRRRLRDSGVPTTVVRLPRRRARVRHQVARDRPALNRPTTISRRHSRPGLRLIVSTASPTESWRRRSSPSRRPARCR